MHIKSRPAATTAISVNVLKSLGYTAVLWGMFLVGFPAAIRWGEAVTRLSALRFDPGPLRELSVVAFACAAAAGFWSCHSLVRFGRGTPMPLECTHRLVVTGPYRYIRNPMSTMGIAQGIAVGVYLGSPVTIAYALVGALLWHWVLRPWEERDLAERFGSAYVHYRDRVPCWLPRLVPYDPPVTED